MTQCKFTIQIFTIQLIKIKRDLFSFQNKELFVMFKSGQKVKTELELLKCKVSFNESTTVKEVVDQALVRWNCVNGNLAIEIKRRLNEDEVHVFDEDKVWGF